MIKKRGRLKLRLRVVSIRKHVDEFHVKRRENVRDKDEGGEKKENKGEVGLSDS